MLSEAWGKTGKMSKQCSSNDNFCCSCRCCRANPAGPRRARNCALSLLLCCLLPDSAAFLTSYFIICVLQIAGLTEPIQQPQEEPGAVICPCCYAAYLIKLHGHIACPRERWQLDVRSEGCTLEHLRQALASAYQVCFLVFSGNVYTSGVFPCV